MLVLNSITAQRQTPEGVDIHSHAHSIAVFIIIVLTLFVSGCFIRQERSHCLNLRTFRPIIITTKVPGEDSYHCLSLDSS